MNFRDEVINNSIWGQKTEITKELIDFYKKNPNELDMIIDKKHFYGRFIKIFFILGIAITVLSRTLKFAFEDTWASFINDVVLDVFSELGIAVFGGAIATFLFKKSNQKQYEENIAFRKEIINRINASQKHTPNDKIE